jgi:hypothetical protein
MGSAIGVNFSPHELFFFEQLAQTKKALQGESLAL